jgi:hypothetical protein
VTKGAIESVIEIMRKYQREAELTKAGALALASLSRVEVNREKLGVEGAVQVVLQGFRNHVKSDSVLTALATATDRLCQDSVSNKTLFIQGEIIDLLLATMSTHEKCTALVGECLRALVTFTNIAPYPAKLRHDESLKLYIRVMRIHEKSDKVARWGCNLIYTCASEALFREKLGKSRRCYYYYSYYLFFYTIFYIVCVMLASLCRQSQGLRYHQFRAALSQCDRRGRDYVGLQVAGCAVHARRQQTEVCQHGNLQLCDQGITGTSPPSHEC